jgi:hypothetical protein
MIAKILLIVGLVPFRAFHRYSFTKANNTSVRPQIPNSLLFLIN